MATLPNYWNLHSMKHSLRIRHQPLREKQRYSSSTRWSTDCSTTQQSQRSTATTSPTASTSWTTSRRSLLSQERLQLLAQTTMEDLHQWTLTTFGGKEETKKAKEKAKTNTGAKDTTRDLTKATKEATTKEDTTRAKEKATQDPKATQPRQLQQSKR